MIGVRLAGNISEISRGGLYPDRRDRLTLISESLHQKGSVCKEHHYVSLEETECPFCHARLLPVENVIDEIVEIARLHGVNVTLVEYRQELMAKYDGIAAVTYVQANLT